MFEESIRGKVIWSQVHVTVKKKILRQNFIFFPQLYLYGFFTLILQKEQCSKGILEENEYGHTYILKWRRKLCFYLIGNIHIFKYIADNSERFSININIIRVPENLKILIKEPENLNQSL